MHVTTRAKVNLSLEIIRRRQDGYHEIETIFQSIDLADEIDIEVTDDAEISITCDTEGIPCDERNLCYKAVVAMRTHAGPDVGARISLRKRIPTESGLGGGSANAAGVMLAIAHARRLRVDRDAMIRSAASIGSDVPFMLFGGTMLGRGRGEDLTPLTPLGGGVFLVVKPQISISTAWAYANYSFQLTKHRPRLNLKAVNAVLARFPGASLSFRNALEDVVCPSHPILNSALEELFSEHPSFASMTGSGSALYAIFDNEEKAAAVAERFSERGFFTSVATPAKRAVDINP